MWASLAHLPLWVISQSLYLPLLNELSRQLANLPLEPTHAVTSHIPLKGRTTQSHIQNFYPIENNIHGRKYDDRQERITAASNAFSVCRGGRDVLRLWRMQSIRQNVQMSCCRITYSVLMSEDLQYTSTDAVIKPLVLYQRAPLCKHGKSTNARFKRPVIVWKAWPPVLRVLDAQARGLPSSHLGTCLWGARSA